MVQTRSGKVHTVEHPWGGVLTPAKKPRREDTAAPKKRCRGKPSELCQLNLDVLFLVRGRSSPDRSLTGVMVLDCRIHPPYRPPESCTHV